MNCIDWREGVAFLCLLLAAWGIGRAADEPADGEISRLEFRVLDVGDDAGPVPSFHYTLTIESAALDEPIRKRDVAHRADDGILRIPEPFPSFGRISLWIDADDLEKGYRHGYESFSYRIDDSKTAKPATIRLRQGTVLTGQVLDAETGKPIAAAEVAPLKHGHHFPWADWDDAAKTDQDGRFRIITTGSEGVEARHAGYRPKEIEGEAREFTVRLYPFVALRGRAVDGDGRPISGVSAGSGDRQKSGADGRFAVLITREEWRDRENREVSLYSPTHDSPNVPLKDFSFDRETVVILQQRPVIRGQVFGENGKPLSNCQVELKCETDFVKSDFYPVSGPDSQGKWEDHFSDYHTEFTVRVSVAGMVRSLQQFTREEVDGGPIITKLAKGRRLSGRLVTRGPLNERHVPLIVLVGTDGTETQRRAKLQPDGRFELPGLVDGKYVLRLHPSVSFQRRGGYMDGGVGAFSRFGFEAPIEPWEKQITMDGEDLEIPPINLHETGMLPGRLKGVVHDPAAGNRPLASGFGYLCATEDDYDTVGGSYYYLRFMTDAQGRFDVPACPPGKYVLKFSDTSYGHIYGDPSVWIRVSPEKTLDLSLFGPGNKNHLAIDFVVGDGSSRHLHAAAGLDPEVIKKYAKTRSGRPPYEAGEDVLLRFEPSEIYCRLEPLDDVTHWPIFDKRFVFEPAGLPKAKNGDIVIPNLSAGRWRLTLVTRYGLVTANQEELPPREFVFRDGMPPLKFDMPPASLAGTFGNPDRKYGQDAKIVAIPQQAGLPTRTCETNGTFRFIGMAPGRYSVRFEGKGCEPKTIENVIVREGEATWLDQVQLKSLPGKAGEWEGPPPA